MAECERSSVIVSVALSCDIFELFDVEECYVRYHSRSVEMASFDRSHTSSYSSSIVTMAISGILSEISRYLSKIAIFS